MDDNDSDEVQSIWYAIAIFNNKLLNWLLITILDKINQMHLLWPAQSKNFLSFSLNSDL